MWPICGKRNPEDQYQSCHREIRLHRDDAAPLWHEGPCIFSDNNVLVRTRDLDAQRAEIERLREDRERLDWIEGSQSSIDPDCESDGSLLCGWDIYTPSGSEHLTTGRTLRDAIDAARAKEKP